MTNLYATPDDFISYFGINETINLTNLDADDPDATTPNTLLLQENLDLSASEVNGWLPAYLQIATPNLKRMTLEVCRYKLDKNLQREDVRKRYEDVIEQLKFLATRPIAQDNLNESEDEITKDSTGGIGWGGGSGVFTPESLGGF